MPIRRAIRLYLPTRRDRRARLQYSRDASPVVQPLAVPGLLRQIGENVTMK